MTNKVDRDALYADVWATPMYQLIEKYGLSAERLRKSCRDLHIPLPERAYWAKKRLGLAIEVPPLPNPDVLGNTEQSDPFTSAALRGRFSDQVKAMISRYEEAERKARQLKARFDWEQCHPGKRYPSAELLWGNWEQFSDEGMILCATHKKSAVRVSVSTWKRGISILQTLMDRLAAADYVVSLPQDEGRVVAERLSARVRIRVGEKIDQEVVTKRKSWDSKLREYRVRTPTGRLFIAVEGPGVGEARISDGLEQKVEDQWDLVMSAVARQHKQAVDANVEHERWRRDYDAQVQARADEERKRKEAEQKAAEEQRRRDDLLLEAEAWQSAALVRRYVAELDRRKEHGASPNVGYEDWRAWALKVADSLDVSEVRVPRRAESS